MNLKRICILLSVLFSWPALAGHVTFNMIDFTDTPLTNRTLTIFPIGAPLTNGAGSIITRDRARVLTGTNGSVTVSNIYGGAYRSEFLGTVTWTTNYFQFPVTNGTINASDWATTAINPAQGILAYSQSQNDAQFWRKDILGPGNNITYRTNNGLVYIDGSAGGSATNAPVSIPGTNVVMTTNGTAPPIYTINAAVGHQEVVNASNAVYGAATSVATNASNLGTGTVPLARLSGITSNEIAAATDAAYRAAGGSGGFTGNTNQFEVGGSVTNIKSGASLTNVLHYELFRIGSNIVSDLSGGNARGIAANDLQTVRNAASQVASGNFTVISGGISNTAASIYGTVAGGVGNENGPSATGGFIGGGGANTNSGMYAVIGGGVNNLAAGSYNAVLGGYQNQIRSAPNSFIGGGQSNAISSDSDECVVVGGANNYIENGGFSAIGGGRENYASFSYSAVAGGHYNTNNAQGGFIGGGERNYNSGVGGAILGGTNNQTTANYATAIGNFLSNGVANRIMLGYAANVVTINDAGVLSGNVSGATNANPTNLFGAGVVPADKLGISGGAGKFLRYDNSWQTIGGGGDMLAANNLTDVASTNAARTNINAHNASNLTEGIVAPARMGSNAVVKAGSNISVSTNWTVGSVNEYMVASVLPGNVLTNGSTVAIDLAAALTAPSITITGAGPGSLVLSNAANTARIVELGTNSFIGTNLTVAGNGYFTNLITGQTDYSTNSGAAVAPDFTKGYTLLQTNAAFTVLAPVGVDVTKAQTTVYAVTNSTAAAIVITAPANVHTVGTWYVTNLSEISFHCYGGRYTNAICLPIW